MTTSDKFWQSQTIDDMTNLQKVWKQDQRISYDIQKIIPHLRGTKTVSDLGCGDGRHIILLNEIFNFEKVFVTDINNLFVFSVLMKTPLNFIGHQSNIVEKLPEECLKTDVVIMNGLIQYIIEDRRLLEIFDSFKNQTLIIKASCYTNEEVYINKYSEELKGEYEAKYRTVEWLLDALKRTFKVVKHERLYPKHLDSKYNSQQTLFIAKS